uniref:Immunoglobulin V-set domain-containing protein n=1 Tax=Oreochromis aureus TaxID=47969 RepID=A0A668SJR5_OREAU
LNTHNSGFYIKSFILTKGIVLYITAGLFDKNTHLINAQTNLYTKVEGEDFRFELDTEVTAGSRKYICRNDSEKEDILIETTENRAESGRYIIRYDISDKKVNMGFNVTITSLTKSDSGRYKCGVRKKDAKNTCLEFEISVTDGDSPCFCYHCVFKIKNELFQFNLMQSAETLCQLPSLNQRVAGYNQVYIILKWENIPLLSAADPGVQ